jgi:uncharacterized phage infection (PIP) family protein YhgE
MKRTLAPPAVALAVAATALTACGGSSKPGYCSDKSNLESTVKGLTSVDIRGDGLGALTTQLKKVETDAKTLVASARSSFPGETSAISSSVDSLAGAIQQLPSSPSAADLLALGGDVTSVTSAVKGFTKAVGSQC